MDATVVATGDHAPEPEENGNMDIDLAEHTAGPVRIDQPNNLQSSHACGEQCRAVFYLSASAAAAGGEG